MPPSPAQAEAAHAGRSARGTIARRTRCAGKSGSFDSRGWPVGRSGGIGGDSAVYMEFTPRATRRREQASRGGHWGGAPTTISGRSHGRKIFFTPDTRAQNASLDKPRCKASLIASTQDAGRLSPSGKICRRGSFGVPSALSLRGWSEVVVFRVRDVG